MPTTPTRRAFLAALGSGILGGCGPGQTVYLVRHAERDESSGKLDKDPPLSALGSRRAQALAGALAGVELSAIYASQYKRTRLTVAPAARARSLEVETVDARDVAGLVQRIRAQPGAVLVSGHSNTVPAIARALGMRGELALREGDFGDLFVVQRSGLTLARRRFEAS